MNGLNSSNDEVVECPLCMEPLEVDDLNFFPCTCGYQICRFCWHRIRTDENELCPACRKAYPENPADFTPLTQEEMIAFKSQKRQRDQQRKQKITENRKHLANVRVVQKNLVFVVGLPPRLADPDILKKHEYFGKYGKIHKVVINPSTAYAGVQGPSASAYVTYVHNCDALRAIQSVNNISIDGRLVKTSLGTTKYCSHFMKNQQCPKGDCMYLHELGDPEASFTKEEMHQGKHQEYEKRLHDALISSSGNSSKNSDSNKSSSSSSSVSNGSSSAAVTAAASGSGSGSQQKEAWPSLSTSPVNGKDVPAGRNRKEKGKSEKARNDKGTKSKNSKNNSISSNNHTGNSSSISVNKENSSQGRDPLSSSNNGGSGSSDGGSNRENLSESSNSGVPEQNGFHNTGNSSNNNNNNNQTKIDKSKGHQEKSSNRNKDQQQQQQQQSQRRSTQQTKGKRSISADDEVKLIEDAEKDSSSNNDRKSNNKSGGDGGRTRKGDGHRSLSSSSNVSSSSTHSSLFSDSSAASSLSEADSSGKSSSGDGPARSESTNDEKATTNCDEIDRSKGTTTSVVVESIRADDNKEKDEMDKIQENIEIVENSNSNSSTQESSEEDKIVMNAVTPPIDASDAETLHGDGVGSASENPIIDPLILDQLKKLNLFDDNSSFFSSSTTSSAGGVLFQQSLLAKAKFGSDLRQANSAATSQLPDLLNGIDGYQNSTTNSNEWEDAFKNVLMRGNEGIDDHLHQHHQQQQQQQEEILRLQEMQKRSSLLSNIGIPHVNGPQHNDFTFNANADLGRMSQASFLQQQQQQQMQQLLQHATPPTEHVSKFFDFHKNQQQQLHQQFLLNSHTPHDFRMPSLLENNRINSQFFDQPNGLLSQQQQHQVQKQRILGKFDPMLPPHTGQQNAQQQQQQQQQHQKQNRISNQYSLNATVDDDLGFDPFIETQKGLAELLETEGVQQQNSDMSGSGKLLPQHQPQPQQQPQPQPQPQMSHQQQLLENMQRARMPPPGFNHMNTFGFGVPRPPQNTSKILPYINLNNSGANGAGGQNSQQHPTIPTPNSWNTPHMGGFQSQQHTLNEPPMSQMNQNSGSHKGFSNTDWTAMDPAILSFRQFSFPQQNQLPQHAPHHPSQQDMFMQHLSQQHQQQQQQQQNGGQGFGTHGGINLPNGVLNQQQMNQAQGNFSHSNWLNAEQSLFMNSLTNGFTNNNFDKFSIPMPPGIHSNGMNKQQQKTECIN